MTFAGVCGHCEIIVYASQLSSSSEEEIKTLVQLPKEAVMKKKK
jgi:hypothetical protein